MGSPVVAASPRKSPSSGRRTNKPLVEKKRRARINGCLGQLKSLILSAMQTEGAQVSRLEKADILEMTVKYLRHIQRQQVTAAVTSEPEVVAKFSAGYSECATEVIRYMDSVQCVTPDVRSRLESHLVERLRGSVPVSAPSAQTPPTMAVSSAPTSTQLTTPQPQAQLVAAYSNHVTSTTPTTSADEMTRHYQTALDLANMAAAVTAKETAAVQAQATVADVHNSPGMSADVSPLQKFQSRVYESSNRNLIDGKDTVRSHSISPASMGMRADESLVTMSSAITSSSSSLYVYDNSHESRRRHSSSEPTFSTSSTLSSSSSSLPDSLKERDVIGMQHHANNDLNNNYMSNSDIHNRTNQTTASSISTSTTNSNQQNISEYLNAFQRPLHIHIPDSPPPATTPSPPFLHPQVSYPHHHPHPQGHVLIAQTAMPFRNPTTEAEESPATILYACDSYQIPPEHQRTSPVSVNPLHSRSVPSHSQNSHDILSSSQAHSNDYRFFSDSNKENNSNQCNAYMQSGKQMTQQVSRMHGNVNNVMSDSNSCARVPVHYSLPHPAVQASVPTPATPSPPTLTREEFYHQAQIAERNGLYDHYNTSNNNTSNYVNYSNDDRMPANTNVCRNTVTLGLRSGYGDHLTGAEEHENSYYSHQPNNNRDTEFRHPSHHYDHISSYPHQSSNQSAIVNTTTAATTPNHLPCREHSSAEQDRITAVYTNTTSDHAMNGPSPHPRAPTRQNETSLSPPTLKKRHLFAQGSESKGTALRCKQGHSGHSNAVSDKRQSLQHVGVGQLEIREKRKVWADGGQAQTRLCRDAQVTSPAAELCTAPAHAVSADDGLWRPW